MCYDLNWVDSFMLCFEFLLSNFIVLFVWINFFVVPLLIVTSCEKLQVLTTSNKSISTAIPQQAPPSLETYDLILKNPYYRLLISVFHSIPKQTLSLSTLLFQTSSWCHTFHHHLLHFVRSFHLFNIQKLHTTSSSGNKL